MIYTATLLLYGKPPNFHNYLPRHTARPHLLCGAAPGGQREEAPASQNALKASLGLQGSKGRKVTQNFPEGFEDLGAKIALLHELPCLAG